MRKLRIEIQVPEDHEPVVRHAMAAKAKQLVDMISSDGPEAFCWSGAANDLVGKMKFTVATPGSWDESDPFWGLQKDGVYRHFKGNEYVIVGFGKDTETEDIQVVYKRLGESGGQIWIRPAAMFAEKIIRDGQEIPRFEFIGATVQSHFI